MDDYLKEILNDRKFRVNLVKESHQWFFSIYFSHYIDCPSAPFHKKFFEITEDQDTKMAVIVSFRQSSKSSIMTTSFPLWSIIGKLQKRFVVLIGKTQRQARLMLDNIKKELESNQVLYKDLGPFKEQQNDLGGYTLYLPWYDAKIIAVSMEQTIRGIRHGKYRPDLILLDDVEDLESVKTLEGRDKIHDWIASEVLPVGQQDTKVIIIGNLLHEDSVLMRLKKKIQNNELKATYLEIPLIDEKNNIAWPGMYPNMQAIEDKKHQVVDEDAWYREYLLKIISNKSRIILPEWIKYYDELPDFDYNKLRYVAVSIDPAISEKAEADKTGIIQLYVYKKDDRVLIYVSPEIFNERMSFPDTIEVLGSISNSLKNRRLDNIVFTEEVAFQTAIRQQLEKLGFKAEGYSPGPLNKSARLKIVAPYVREGTVMFPRKGAEVLIGQLTNFGIEKYDDLADAFTMALHMIFTTDFEGRGIVRKIKSIHRSYNRIKIIYEDEETFKQKEPTIEDTMFSNKTYPYSMLRHNGNGNNGWSASEARDLKDLGMAP